MKTSYKNSIIILGACAVGLLGGYIASEKFLKPSEKDGNFESAPAIINANFINDWPIQTGYYRQTPYGNYLAGNFAQKQNDWDKASDYISRVLEKEKDNYSMLKHAMVLAMGAGDAERAVGLADDVLKNEPNDLLATLFKTAENFKLEKYDSVKENLKAIEKDSIAAFIVPVLYLWADTAKGEFKTDNLGKNTFFIYQAMMASDYVDKPQKALAFANDRFSLSSTDVRDIERIGDYYAKLGAKDNAIQLYELLVKEKFASEKTKKKLAALKNNQPIADLLDIPVIKTPKDGSAQIFLSMAEILLREQSFDSALIFTRISLYLNPELNDSKMLLGRILTQDGQYDDAIAIYKTIPKKDKNHVLAQRGIANLLVEKEQNDDAIKILEGIYNEYADLDAIIQIGDIYRYEENYDKAVKAYTRVTEKFDTVPEDYWHVLYARGMAYERLKKFKKSEEDLLAALDFRPEHPFLLNYLGYSWADQGINLDRAMEMINKAFEIKPDDGYIADSVGWVHYKVKNYDAAIEFLETAVELLPYDATINDHLGDAYWQVGRKNEAKFQWQRAINNAKENETELKEKIIAKLDQGYLNEEKMAELIKQEK